MKRDETQRRHTFIKYAGITVLAVLMLVSIAGANPYAYITNYDDATVSVIDTATNNITATINVEKYPEGVAVNPDGTRIYVTGGSKNVSVIDTATNNVMDSIPVDSNSHGISVNPAGTRVYVTNPNSNNVSVIDTATNKVRDTINVGNHPLGVVVTPDGKKVYVTNQFSQTVSVIDTGTNSITSTIYVGPYPIGVAVNSDGSKVYVTSTISDDGAVSVIDTTSNTITATILIGSRPLEVAVNPDGTKVYVTNSGSNTVSVIDTVTNNVIATVDGFYEPWGIAVTPDGSKVYVANRYGNDIVSVIDTATNNVITTVSVGNQPVAFGQFIAYVPVQPVVPVANFSSNVTVGYAPLFVQFTDLSEDATEWKWDFGDGATSTDQNTTHTYSAAGTYIVNLTATNENGTDSKTATINVLAAPLKTPTINWSNPADIISGTTLSSTQLNAEASVLGTFVYTPPAGTLLSAGPQKLKVDFTPTDTANYTTASKDVTINVLEKPVPPVADFSASSTIGKASLTVIFTDKSTGSPTSWSWNFGDKSISTAQNPVHIYSKAGKYTVSLTVKNALGTNTRKISNYIIVKK